MPAQQFDDSVQPQALRKVRPIPGFEDQASEVAFGGDKNGEPLARLAEDAGSLPSKHKANAAKAQAELLYHDYVDEMVDNTNEALKIKGDKATGNTTTQKPDSWMSRAKDLETKYNDLAKNDDVRAVLGPMMGDTRNKHHELVSRHELEQFDYTELTSKKGTIESLTKQAVNFPEKADDYYDKDGKKVPGFFSQIRSMAISAGKKGDADKMVLQAQDLVVRGMISRAKTADDQKKIEEFISSHSMPSVGQEVALDKLKTLTAGDDFAKEAFNNRNFNSEAASKDIEDSKTLSEPEKKEAQKHLISLGKDKESMSNNTALEAARQATDVIQKWQKDNPGKVATPQDVVGAGVFSQLGGTNVKLGNALRQSMEHMMDPMYVGDSVKLNDFLSNKDAMARMDKADFSKDVLQHLNSQQQGVAKEAYESMHPKNGGIGSPTRDMAKADWMKAAIVGIMPQDERVKVFAKWPAKYKTLFENLDSNIKSEEAYYYATNKKLPELDEVKKMINNQLLNTYMASGDHFWNGKEAAPFANIKAGTVPAQEFDRIKSAFTKFTPTTDQIFRVYQAQKTGNAKLIDKILNGDE